MKYFIAVFLVSIFGMFGLISLLDRLAGEERDPVIYLSPTECKGNHGVWRWDAKVDAEKPPDKIPEDHHVTPAIMKRWLVPYENIGTKSPRRGREREWYCLTGRVVLVRAEEDGDLHILLSGEKPQDNDFWTVAEVPLGKPWEAIRKEVFGWSSAQKFPFTCRIEHELKLDPFDSDPATKRPVIRVVGKAFFDAEHKTDEENLRSDHKTIVWEIHPIMKLETLSSR